MFAKGGDKVTWNQVLVLVGAELLAPGPILCWSLRGGIWLLVLMGESFTVCPLWPRTSLLLWVLHHPAWSWSQARVATEQRFGGLQRGGTTSRTTRGGLVGLVDGEDLLPTSPQPPSSLALLEVCNPHVQSLLSSHRHGDRPYGSARPRIPPFIPRHRAVSLGFCPPCAWPCFLAVSNVTGLSPQTKRSP